MINRLFNKETLTSVRREPARTHWTQSPLEQVVDARILLCGEDFVLLRTDFLAPMLTRHATWRTEDVGGTQRRIYEMHNNIQMYQNVVRWFYKTSLPDSYAEGLFPHEDYTLRVVNQEMKAFVNLRKYPAGSYLVDLVQADLTVYDALGEPAISGATSSYVGGAESNDPLKPQQRTKTLEALAQQNRLRQGRIFVQTPEGIGETQFDSPMTLVAYDNFPTLRVFPMSEEILQTIHRTELREVALQRVLTNFKYLLEESCVTHRN